MEKKISLLFLFILLMSFCSCYSNEVNNVDIEKQKERICQDIDTEEKDGVIYFIGEKDPYTGKIISFVEDGKLKIEAKFKEGLLNGEMILYKEDGEIKGIINFKNGEQNGKIIFYNENGEIINNSQEKFEEQIIKSKDSDALSLISVWRVAHNLYYCDNLKFATTFLELKEYVDKNVEKLTFQQNDLNKTFDEKENTNVCKAAVMSGTGENIMGNTCVKFEIYDDSIIITTFENGWSLK